MTKKATVKLFTYLFDNVNIFIHHEMCYRYIYIYIYNFIATRIDVTLDNMTDEAQRPIAAVEELCVNATSGDDIKAKLKKACRRDKTVYLAQKYCTKVKRGKYFCIKNWKCLKHKDFCTGCVKHQCEVYGQYENVTINLVLQKQNKSRVKVMEKGRLLHTSVNVNTENQGFNHDDTVLDGSAATKVTRICGVCRFFLFRKALGIRFGQTIHPKMHGFTVDLKYYY